MTLKGKTILVTGGGGAGIARGICTVLMAQGARLVINEKTPVEAERAGQTYPNAVTVAADISQPAEVESMFNTIHKTVGTLDGLVNNAGVGLSKFAHEADTDDFNRLYNVDIKGLWLVSKGFVGPLLRSGKPGVIVNISSVHGHAAMPRYGLYASVKSAVQGLTRGMAVELGPNNIRVNAVGPGYVHSDQNEDLLLTWTDDPVAWVENYIKDQQVLNRPVESEDCGNVVAFLLSDASRSITGQTIYVDNGTTSMLYNQKLTLS